MKNVNLCVYSVEAHPICKTKLPFWVEIEDYYDLICYLNFLQDSSDIEFFVLWREGKLCNKEHLEEIKVLFSIQEYSKLKV